MEKTNDPLEGFCRRVEPEDEARLAELRAMRAASGVALKDDLRNGQLSAELEAEFHAMRECMRLLSDMDYESQHRVLSWLGSRVHAGSGRLRG